jgi:hypothetical protein
MGNSLIFLSLLGVMAMAAESYLRFVAVFTDAFGVSLPARRWFAIHTQLNSLGCRDKESTIEKPTGVRRIAFVGDSFTYGWGIEETADRFSDRIQSLFDTTVPGTVEIMNVAKPGWGTGDQIQPIRDVVALYHVDEIVLCYVPNDIEKLIPASPGFIPTRPPEYSLLNLDSSPLLDYLYRRICLPRVPTVRDYHDWLAQGFADPDVWHRHVAQFHEIIRFSREHNVAFRVVLLPFLRTSGRGFDPRRIHDRLQGVWYESEASNLDLLPLVSGYDVTTLVVNSNDPHPNELAHEHFATSIWEAFYHPQ